MNGIFIIEKNKVFPDPNILLIPVFKKIWDRDKDKNKTNALEDLAYVEFMTSFKKNNPFRQYPEERKHDVVSKTIITRENWEVDELLIEAMEMLVKFQKEASTTYQYYIAAKKAAENMQNFFTTVDIITNINPKTGNPIYKPRDITSALNDTAKVLKTLKELEIKVEEELFEDSKKRGGKEISPYATGERNK